MHCTKLINIKSVKLIDCVDKIKKTFIKKKIFDTQQILQFFVQLNDLCNLNIVFANKYVTFTNESWKVNNYTINVCKCYKYDDLNKKDRFYTDVKAFK